MDEIKTETIYHYILSRDDDVKFDNVYNGSTNNIHFRFNKHRQDCNKNNSKLYKYIKENGGFDRFVMTVIEEQIVQGNTQERRKQTFEREEELRTSLCSTLNKNRPVTNHEQKKQYRRDYYREYYRTNVEQKEKNKTRVLNRYHAMKKK